jgi:hypothetical protein
MISSTKLPRIHDRLQVNSPRLNHLMYVEGRWEDNVHTLAGKDIHRRLDRIANLLL